MVLVKLIDSVGYVVGEEDVVVVFICECDDVGLCVVVEF